MSSPQPPLRILCFGASLVKGYTASGTQHYPYSTWLSQVLGQRYPGREIDVETDGVSGDMVTQTYERRMRAQCKFCYYVSVLLLCCRFLLVYFILFFCFFFLLFLFCWSTLQFPLQETTTTVTLSETPGRVPFDTNCPGIKDPRQAQGRVPEQKDHYEVEDGELVRQERLLSPMERGSGRERAGSNTAGNGTASNLILVLPSLL